MKIISIFPAKFPKFYFAMIFFSHLHLNFYISIQTRTQISPKSSLWKVFSRLILTSVSLNTDTYSTIFHTNSGRKGPLPPNDVPVEEAYTLQQ